MDGEYAYGFIDWDKEDYTIPDTGTFGYRTIGSDAPVDVSHFRVHRIEQAEYIRKVAR